jgi:hypothetical protein
MEIKVVGGYMSEPIEKKAKGRNWSWILWWKVDQSEIEDQIQKYGTLNLFKSARGQAVLCLLFSVAATATMILLKSVEISSSVDIGIFVVLAVFIYFGHRWAMLAAMVFWTLEKVYVVYAGAGVPGSNPVVQLIWWCIYMHAFYFAFRVEKERRTRTTESIA